MRVFLRHFPAIVITSLTCLLFVAVAQDPQNAGVGAQWAPDPTTIKQPDENPVAELGELPPGFPEAIPIPVAAMIDSGMRMDGSDGSVNINVSYRAVGKPIDAFYLYHDYLRSGDWEQIDYGSEGTDPNPYITWQSIDAVSGNVSLSFSLGREAASDGLDVVSVMIAYQEGNVYLSDTYEDTWYFRNEHYWEPTETTASFDQDRWRNQKIHDSAYLPDGWPREFHVPEPYLRHYEWHEADTEPSSSVQVTGDDDGSKRLIFRYALRGRALMPYQVHKNALEEAGFMVIIDTGSEQSGGGDGTAEPLQLVGTRDGAALQVIVHQQEFSAVTELVYDENFAAAFY